MKLVTGATGIVGTHLLLELTAYLKEIRASYHSEKGLEKVKFIFDSLGRLKDFNRLEWVYLDITDIISIQKVIKNIDMVYHCAGLVSFNDSDEKKLKKINTEGTKNLVNVLLDFPHKKMVHISTIAVLNDTINLPINSKIDESIGWNPKENTNAYARSKYGGEIEVYRGIQEGLQAVIVNPSVILSTYFKNKSSNQILEILKKYGKYYTSGTVPFIDADELAKIIVVLSEDKSCYKERFIVHSESLSYKKLITTINLFYKKSVPKKLPYLIWKIFYNTAPFLKFIFGGTYPLSRKLLKSLNSKSDYSTKKLTSYTKINITKINIEKYLNINTDSETS